MSPGRLIVIDGNWPAAWFDAAFDLEAKSHRLIVVLGHIARFDFSFEFQTCSSPYSMLMANGGASSPAQRVAPAARSYRREREGESLTRQENFCSGIGIVLHLNRRRLPTFGFTEAL
jgi:hypothetical protein